MIGLFYCLISSQLSAGNIIVSDYEALKLAISKASSGDSILMRNGTYEIADQGVVVSVENITIKSLSGNRDSVILRGSGMFGSQIQHGFWVNADKVSINGITVKEVRNHCIQTNSNIDSLHVRNCVLADAGEQLFKVPSGGSDLPSEGGIVEHCLFEYTAGIGPQYYIGGIDCHFAIDWIVRNNIFKSIRSPELTIAEHAIHFWSDSKNNLVEKNLIINCDRGIGFGLGTSGNTGGIIRNNMIYHDETKGDVGIGLETSPDTEVYNNTIYFENDYFNAIEYRFSETHNVYIANNLTNRQIASRNGAQGTVENNNANAVSGWFTDTGEGDLHLSRNTLSGVIDRGATVTGLVDDFDGDPRPQGAGIDIGADEFFVSTDLTSKPLNNTPSQFFLYQNYPNPFNPYTTIAFDLPEHSDVVLKIYNLLGETAAILADRSLPAGKYTFHWEPKGLSSGVYVYVIQANNFRAKRKMVLVK